MRVKINKYFSIQSVIFNLPNVLKDLLLTSANFAQLLSLCFSLICLLKLSVVQAFILLMLISQSLAFSKDCVGDISYYVQHFPINVYA